MGDEEDDIEDDYEIVPKQYLAELEYNTQFLSILMELGLAEEEIFEDAHELRESRLH